MAMQTPNTGLENRFSRVVTGIALVVWLVGIAWLWLNTGGGSLLVQIAVVVVLGSAWGMIVALGGAVLAIVLGIGVIAASPFRRR